MDRGIRGIVIFAAIYFALFIVLKGYQFDFGLLQNRYFAFNDVLY